MHLAAYVATLTIVGFSSLYLAIYTWKKSRHIFFSWLSLSTAIWAFGYMVEILTPSLSMKIIAAKFEYVGIVFIPVSWFATVLEYTGKEKWIRNKVAYFLVIPIITLILVWTNEFHHLIWKRTYLRYFNGSPFLSLVHGSYFWIHVSYSYSLVIFSLFFLAYAVVSFPPSYIRKTIALIFGALIPLIGNALYVFNANPIYPIDVTPFTTFIGVVAMAFAVVRLKALDVIPIAREKIIEMMEDAIFVIDNEGNIIYANKSAKNVLGEGKKILKEINKFGEECREVMLNGRHFCVSVVSLQAKEGVKLVIFHDITYRKEAENRIKKLNEELTLINKIVRHDILNDLQIIQGFLEMDYGGDKEVVEKVMKRIEKMARLIKRTKDVELLALNENFREYDMREVIKNVAKGYEIKINIKGDCKAKVDESIYSVIDNIILNAMVHGKANQIDVELENKNGCTIKIADNGIGIPDEIKNKIFNEGFSYGEAKGSGLGLYIVKKIIEKYGGSIEVGDNKPNGAIFIIKLF